MTTPPPSARFPHGCLNERAWTIAESLIARAEELRIAVLEVPGGGRVIDCGLSAPGGLEAGLALARVCLAGLGEAAIVPGEVGGWPLPAAQVRTDHPVAACLASQYAGWAVQVDGYFAMGSGPMRAAAGREELYRDIGLVERPERVVGVLETRTSPTPAVFRWISEKTAVAPEKVLLLMAPTASIAGGLQVVARSVETALHKLHALGFDLGRIACGWGSAPIPPVARGDLQAIGRTNDCILYGGRAVLWVRGDDESIARVGPQVPSSASPDHGAPFLEIFERSGRDFYRLDPRLFSPAEVVFQNLDSGRTQRFGRQAPEVLARSLFDS